MDLTTQTIDDILIRFFPIFANKSYIDGELVQQNTMIDIWCNLYLTIVGLRPSFMVQWIDYINSYDYIFIMKTLCDFRDILKCLRDTVDLLFITIDQGVIITTYNYFYDNNGWKYFSDYSETRSNNSLGKILGYPGNNEFENSEKFITIAIKYLDDTEDIMSIIYMTTETRSQIYDMFYKFRKSIRKLSRHLHLELDLILIDNDLSDENENEEDDDDLDNNPDFLKYLDFVDVNKRINDVWYTNDDLDYYNRFFHDLKIRINIL